MLQILGLALVIAIFAIGGLIYFLLGRSMFARFAITEPIKGAVLSLLGVFVFALFLGGVILMIEILLQIFHFR